MKKNKVSVTEGDLTSFEGDLLIFLATQREDKTVECDEQIRPLLELQMKLEDFAAKENDILLIYPEAHKHADMFSAKRIAVVGLGKMADDIDERIEAVRSAGGVIAKLCTKLRMSTLMIAQGPDLGCPAEHVAEAFCEGVLLGDYQFLKYKKEDEENPKFKGIQELRFAVSAHSTSVRKAVKRAARVAKATCAARDMANEPGNQWTAASFAEYAQGLTKKLPLKCTVFGKQKIKQLGMGGLLAVNQGSSEPPKLIVLDYEPEKYEKTILLVGKGLTFDSGGISLKPAAGMQDMKYDMCGGAAVLATMQAIAEEKSKVRVVGIIPATDNMSGSSAIKPGDIIRQYNGLTSEVVNTDAEGRLILADGLAYGIEQYQPDYTIDVATLTGAAIIGLGHHHTCILSNDDKLADSLIQAGKKCAEPLWRLPLGKEYTKQIESQVADVKNAGGRPGGTITAAAYLQKFVGDSPWAHLDIAGTAWDFTEKTYIPKGPSGIAVRTLVEFVRGI